MAISRWCTPSPSIPPPHTPLPSQIWQHDLFLKKPFSDIIMTQSEIPISLPKNPEIALLASMYIGFQCLYTLLHHVPCLLIAYPCFYWLYLMLQSCSAHTSIPRHFLHFYDFFVKNGAGYLGLISGSIVPQPDLGTSNDSGGITASLPAPSSLSISESWQVGFSFLAICGYYLSISILIPWKYLLKINFK